MTVATVAAFALTALLAQAPPAGSAQQSLANVKELYASASYEEALERLAAAEETLAYEQVEQYRALCLLGLGRTEEAERSLERLVSGKPLYVISETEFSPRIVTMFRDVRKRLLPATARDMYAFAKDSFDKKHYGPAVTQFTELLTILGDADLALEADGLRDLKLLGEGFLKLAEGEVAAAKAAAASRAAAPAAVAAAPRPVVPAVYSSDDAGVVSPTEIERRMPAWNPPSTALRAVQYRGVLEVVINERGAVESAVMRVPVNAAYDVILLDAAKKWRFQPATVRGQAVKFRKSFEIVLAPR